MHFFHVNDKDLCSNNIYVSKILRFPYASLLNKIAKKWPVLKNNLKETSPSKCRLSTSTQRELWVRCACVWHLEMDPLQVMPVFA